MSRTDEPYQAVDHRMIPDRKQNGERSMNRRLLLVAYYFPPMGLSGVVRVSKFAKYLQSYGWDVTVLTVEKVGYFAHDDDLLREVLDSGVEIVRTRTLDPLGVVGRRRREVKRPGDRTGAFLRGITHAFLQPDNKIGWKRYAVAAGQSLLEERRYDAILASAPPFTSFLVARELSRLSGVPFVVDYRDPWLDNRNYFYATPFHRRYAAGLEKEILKNAESVVVVNRRIKEGLLARWPFLTHETVHILPSGFDPTDVENAEPERVAGEKMRFLFSGIFPPKLKPAPFFAALAKVFRRRPELRDQIELTFIGSFRDAYRKMARKAGVESSIRTPGYVPHREVMDWLLSADVLWLMIDDPRLTPGKIYEYMGTRRPILALAGEGVVRSLLDSYGASIYVRPDDVDGIADAIESFYEAWRSGRLPVGDEDAADAHNIRNLSRQLEIILSHAMRL